jgi:hypothetical protein
VPKKFHVISRFHTISYTFSCFQKVANCYGDPIVETWTSEDQLVNSKNLLDVMFRHNFVRRLWRGTYKLPAYPATLGVLRVKASKL